MRPAGLGLATVVWLGQCCPLVSPRVRTDMGRGEVALPVLWPEVEHAAGQGLALLCGHLCV